MLEGESDEIFSRQPLTERCLLLILMPVLKELLIIEEIVLKFLAKCEHIEEFKLAIRKFIKINV